MKNNFDLVRVALALIVVLVHLATLTNLPEFGIFMDYLSSDFAVKGFFAVSGYLVMQSYVNSKTLCNFAEKRIRRIYPAYLATIFLCLGIGIYATRLSTASFLTSPETLKYLLLNAAFLNFAYPNLPGVFENHYLSAMDGALWTIKIEVCLYFCIPLIFYMFKKFGNYRIAVLTSFFSVLWILIFKYFLGGRVFEEVARQFPGQLSYFILGCLLFIERPEPKNLARIVILSSLLFVLFRHQILRLVIEPVFYSCLVIFLATQSKKSINFGKFGDLSYGTYLLHFPIIQLFIHLGLYKSNAWFGLIITIATILIFAMISWRFIERPTLKRSSHYIQVNI